MRTVTYPSNPSYQLPTKADTRQMMWGPCAVRAAPSAAAWGATRGCSVGVRVRRRPRAPAPHLPPTPFRTSTWRTRTGLPAMSQPRGVTKMLAGVSRRAMSTRASLRAKWRERVAPHSARLWQHAAHNAGWSRNNRFTAAFARAWTTYSRWLSDYPYRTNMTTCAVLFIIGDIIAQCIEQRDSEDTTIDTDRAAKAAITGVVTSGWMTPLNLRFLEYLFTRGPLGFVSARMVPVGKLFVEEFVFYLWVNLAAYFAVQGALKGQTVQKTLDDMPSNIWEAAKLGWLFWVPVQLINFKFIPVKFQAVWAFSAAIGWVSILSLTFSGKEAPLDDKDAATHADASLMPGASVQVVVDPPGVVGLEASSGSSSA